MANVSVTDGTLVVEIAGLDRLWAIKSRIEIPLANVRGATLDPGILREPKGIRVGGTHFPGLITAGTFRSGGEWVFWDVKNPAKAVVIELADERYSRLVIEVDDPRATVDLVELARCPG
ncbi:hypothetical protein [Streptomyces sp. CB01881]|uniref:hypothetical protein n=1 Tax=Streptomyces sp. CB01881 TaxID=2078691 RepID=UPI000CDCC7D6|nr:hypothetical protein [Streptomyces sp. CB01881]AUY48856.1 hypothetical protein C2142_07740 [Streptomyces sp. CB01881]TYC77344.1 hypothetical protein EH183_07750 [Streptomyces sp. CB01881]